MKVQLQNERGEAIAGSVVDEKNVLPKLLLAAGANNFIQLRHLDLYGDTTFNKSQLEVVAGEWTLLLQHAGTNGEKDFLRAVAELLERGKSEVHVYVKFIGD